MCFTLLRSIKKEISGSKYMLCQYNDTKLHNKLTKKIVLEQYNKLSSEDKVLAVTTVSQIIKDIITN